MGTVTPGTISSGSPRNPPATSYSSASIGPFHSPLPKLKSGCAPITTATGRSSPRSSARR